MNTCKNCKYFKRSKYSWKKYGDCESKKFLYAFPVDDHIESWDEKIERTETPLQETDCLIYMDSESYSAFCKVGEDFGCIHFEEG